MLRSAADSPRADNFLKESCSNNMEQVKDQLCRANEILLKSREDSSADKSKVKGEPSKNSREDPGENYEAVEEPPPEVESGQQQSVHFENQLDVGLKLVEWMKQKHMGEGSLSL